MDKVQSQIKEMRVKDFCFCISLRRATLTIGYLDVVLSAILMLASLTVSITARMHNSNPSTSEPPDKHDELVHNLSTVGLAVMIILLLVTTVFFGFSVILLIGVYKKRPNYIKYWLRFVLVLAIFEACGSIVSLFSGSSGSGSEKGGHFASGIVSFAWSVYTWIVVRSFYRELKEELSRHAPVAVAFKDVNPYNHGSTEFMDPIHGPYPTRPSAAPPP